MKKLESLRVILSKPKWLTILIALALISLNIWLLSKIGFIFDPLWIVLKTVLIPVVIAGVFYYLFNPIVDWAEERGVKRWISILLIYIASIWGLIMTLSYVIPTMIRQIKELFLLIPIWWKEFQIFIDKWDKPSWVMDILEKTQTMVDDLPSVAVTYGSELLIDLGSQLFPIFGAVIGTIAVLITTPFVLFYMLKDGKKLPDFIIQFLPVKVRRSSRTILHEMNTQISSYIRGQIIVCLCLGVLFFIGYLIIDFPYALTLAIIASLTSVIPYVGPTIAITPAILIAVFNSPILLIKVIIVWIVVQTLEGKFITPQIMGKSIKVHPLTILFTIICAGKIFGVWGMVFAIPGYAVTKVIVTYLFNWVKDVSGLYKEETLLSKEKKTKLIKNN